MSRQHVLVIGLAGAFVVLLFFVLVGHFAPTTAGGKPRLIDNSDAGVSRSIAGTLILVVGLLFYLIPSVVAFVREHQNVLPIFILNLFFGWTLLGWVICLAWSFSSDVRESRQYIKQVIIKNPADEDS